MAAKSTEAAKGQAFKALQRYYREPLNAAREAHKAGERVIGRIGNTVPVELILAGGFTPVMVSAERGRAAPTAAHYIDDIVPPETHILFEQAVAGDYEFLDLLLFSRTYDKLFYYLKEMYRLGRAAKLPPTLMFDLMQSQRPAVRTYNARQLRSLIEALERAAGAEITDTAVWDAIALVDRTRALQRELLALRAKGIVAGSEAMQAIGAGYFLHPKAYGDLLAGYLADLKKVAEVQAVPGRRLLVVTSEPLSHTQLHDTLEAAGAYVSAEDDWWGSRAPGENVPLASSPADAILQKCWLDTPTSGVYPPEAREAWFMAQSWREDIDGVVFYVPPSDILFGWDYPRLAADLAGRGKPSMLIRQDVTQSDDRPDIQAQVAEFLAKVGAKSPVAAGA